MQRLFITAISCLISVSLFGQNQQSIIIDDNQWIEIPAWTPSESYTLSAWVSFPLPNATEGDWHTLFSKDIGGDHHILFHDDGQLGIYNAQNFVGCGYSANDIENGYHYISAVAYGNSTDFYVDGEFVGTSGEKVIGIMHVIGNISIPPFGGNQPIGQIDDVSIWNYAQDEASINQFMNCPPNGSEPGLISHYNFELSQTIVYDLSSNNFHGNVIGEPLFSSYTPENNCESDSDDCNGQDFCGQGTVWDEVTETCISSVVCPPCDNDCPGDYDGDGSVTATDLLDFLILFGNQCE